MMPPQTPATFGQAKKAYQNSPKAGRAMRRTARAALLILFIAAVSVSAALPGSTAARLGSRAVPHGAPAAPPSKASKGAGLMSSVPLAPSAFIFQTAAAPIATYAADCATAKDSFNLGDVVCVKVSGAPASGAAVIVSDPDLFQRSAALSVTANAQSFSFTLPSSSTTGGTDNRGTWAASIINTEDNSRRGVATFLVHDPQEPVADVTISKTALDSSEVTAGGNASFRIYVTNQGPDPASTVTFTDNTLPNTTFVSFAQESGPTFNCTPPAVGSSGSTTCTAAAMAVGAAASFTAVYNVNSAIGNNTELEDTAVVSSSTTDSHPSSNSSTVDSTASNPNPPACTISCPANITQDSDPGQAGAVVTYADPATSGSCGAVATDHPSGSFFPIGTTTVTATIAGGPSCSFSVTVVDKRTVSITLNGSADMTVECHTGFSDPGATAADGDGNQLAVTATVTVPDPNGGTDQNGDALQVPAAGNAVNPNAPNTYTITYSATANNSTATAKRTVHVVDTAPPVISIAGSQNFGQETETTPVLNGNGDVIGTTTTLVYVMTVECHSPFTPPAATAADGCDATPAAVTVSGSVDPNTVGDYALVYSASDSTGNDATQKLKVLVRDTTGPVITLNAGPSTVECHTSYTDPGASAADGCEGPVPVSASGSVDPNTVGTYTITYTASDAGGRTTTATRTIQVVDTIAPTVTLNGAASVTVLQYSSFSDPGATAADGCAGALPVSVSGTVNTNAVGTYTLTYSATDPSGNTGTATRTVKVIFNFTGFFSPVNNAALNQANAGRSIPVKFSLGGNQGLNVLGAGSPYSQQVTCGSNNPTDLQETGTAGSSSLSYDASSNQYIYVWKTESSWAGTCRVLTVLLSDGTTHTANFKFK